MDNNLQQSMTLVYNENNTNGPLEEFGVIRSLATLKKYISNCQYYDIANEISIGHFRLFKSNNLLISVSDINGAINYINNIISEIKKELITKFGNTDNIIISIKCYKYDANFYIYLYPITNLVNPNVIIDFIKTLINIKFTEVNPNNSSDDLLNYVSFLMKSTTESFLIYSMCLM